MELGRQKGFGYIYIYRVFKVWGRAFVDSGLSFLLRISALRVYTIGF